MHLTCPGRFKTRTVVIRLLLALAGTITYALIFLLLYPVAGGSLDAIAILPPAAAGWLLGWRVGLLNGVLISLLDRLLYSSLAIEASIIEAIPGLIAVLTIGALVGWLSDMLYRINRQGQALNRERMSLMEQIVQREQIETALLQARDNALEANRLKNELLARVSHELRTPLTAIIGYAELLAMGALGELSAEQEKAISHIIGSSRYLTVLVNELLDQANLEAKRLKLEISSFDPRDLVAEICTRMSLLAQDKGLTLSAEVAAELPAMLSGDRRRLRQILINLVNNAIKFTAAGAIRVYLYRSGERQWAIQVVDTGPGISKEVQNSIFEPFWQADGSITRKYGGMGLGLSIVQQLVALMEGEMKLESEVGRGSTFTVLLPLNPAA
jgi:signal transduction histidine kinase